MVSEERIPVLIVMGVCGAGKSALAAQLADRLGRVFVEGDKYHSEAARELMSRGKPLTDEQRVPWLDRVAIATKAAVQGEQGVVIACSALRRSYRDQLRSYFPDAVFVQLSGDRDLIASRLDNRKNHFVGEPLLDSQLETLEPLMTDETGMVLDVARPLAALANDVLQTLGNGHSAFPGTRPVHGGIVD